MGPSSPDTSGPWGPQQQNFILGLNPRNPPWGVASRTQSTRDWWRRVHARATAHSMSLSWSTAETDALFADPSSPTIPSLTEMVGAGYVASDAVPDWVTSVDISTKDLHRFGSRFILRARRHIAEGTESASANSATVWQLDVAADWFLRDYLALKHAQVTDPIVRHFRILHQRQSADDLEGLVPSVADREPRLASSGDAESRFPGDSP